MNTQQTQIFSDTLRRYKKGVFFLGASFCYLLAGQPLKASVTEKENVEPKRRKQDIGRLINETNVGCGKKSLLDRLESQSKNTKFMEPANLLSVLVGTDNCPGLMIPAATYTAAAPYTDSGTTVGANNTVTSIQGGCSTYTTNAGPDVIYRFTLPVLAARPAATSITVTPTGATGYDTSVYILSSSGTACPAGTANAATNCVTGNDSAGFNGAETITDAQLDAIPAGDYYLFVDSFYSAGNTAQPTRQNGPYTLTAVGTFTAPTAAEASVSGRVVNAQGRGIAKVRIALTDNTGQIRFVTTNPFGYYRIDSLNAGEVYIFQVSSKQYLFPKGVQAITVNQDLEDVNFTALP